MGNETPAIPFITPKQDKNTYDFMSAVKQWIEIREGRRGDKDNRYITFKESRIRVDEKVNSLPSSSDAFVPDATPPAPARGLTLISSGMGSVEIGWTKPADTDVQFYRVYGDVINSFNIASTTLQGTVVAPVTKFVHKWTHPLSTAYTWYYWIVVEDKTGNLSAPIGPLTVKATSTYDNALSNIVQAIIDNTTGKVTFLGDRLNVAPPTGTVATTIQPFYAGVIDGVAAVALKGDLFVDGTVNAKCITAGTIYGDKINSKTAISLNEGGILSLGYSGSEGKADVEVITDTGSGQGKLIVYDGLSNPGYNSTTEFWRSTIAHYVNTEHGTTFENPPRRLVTGFCKHRARVNIPGYFPHMPQVVVFPSFAWGATGKLTCHPGPLTSIAFGQWSFTMYCSMSGTNTQNRAPNEEIEVPYSSFISTPITSSRIYCKEDGTSSYSYTRIAARIMVRAQSGEGNNPTGSIMTITIYGRKSNGVEVAYPEQVYADTDHRSYWLMVDSPDLLFDSIRVVATHSSTVPSKYRWPIGTGKASLRVEMMISYPTIPAATNEVGSYLAYF